MQHITVGFLAPVGWSLIYCIDPTIAACFVPVIANIAYLGGFYDGEALHE